MKKWVIPTVVIAGTFIIVGLLLNRPDPSDSIKTTPATSKKTQAITKKEPAGHSNISAHNIHVEMPKAIQAMRNGNWKEAHQSLQRVTDNYANRAYPIYGAKFGIVYYEKGRMEMKLGAKHKAAGDKENLARANQYYLQAIESFKSCRKYTGNKYQHKALLYWGESLQAMGLYSEAITQYEKFLKNISNKRAR